MTDPTQAQAAARAAVMECEQEIQNIKAALRQLSAVDSGDPNSVEVVLLKVEGLPDTAKPKVTIQLSSPIEEATLTDTFDPTNTDTAPESSMAVFQGVETAVATLVVSASDSDIPLGSSAPHDLAPLCRVNAMDLKEKYETELPIAIVSDDQVAKKDTNEAKDMEEDKGKVEVSIQPICTVTLRVTYKPSPKDQKEELYELLNKTSQRKATAVENLRKISTALARAGGDPSSKLSSTNNASLAKPAVRPGFLNKKNKKEPTKMEKFYEQTFGPNSILRKGLGLLVFAKDYVIFIGAVSFFHFKGQTLALPAPV